ncbi:hypothetical protein C2E23DRAFT_559739 [Lenzites betulinus]|nr:hypothetical protein C2E23DRAFT_559739 [Lenzites betulinus]
MVILRSLAAETGVPAVLFPHDQGFRKSTCLASRGVYGMSDQSDSEASTGKCGMRPRWPRPVIGCASAATARSA